MAFNWIKFPWTNLHDLNLDWIIQTVKTLENNLSDAVSTFQEMINKAISSTLTGSGDLTINKTGDIRISGNSVQLSRTVMSDTSEQITLHNPNSNTNMTANYNNGVLRLTNNQNLETGGVAVYHINTPADGGGDNSTFAANVGYVKDAVAAVDSKLNTDIDSKLAKLLTGSGDLTIDKTGDVNISGNSIELSNTTISSQGDQLTLHNSASNTSMTATYNAGMLRLQNNQSEAGGVAMYPIVTLPDNTGDNSKYAANVGYVKDAVNPLSEQLAAIEKRAPRVFYFENDTTTNTVQNMTAGDTAALKAALVNHTPIILIAKTQGTQYCYLPVNCAPVPTADNINDPNTDFTYTFQTVNNMYRAMVSYASTASTSTVVFQTIS